MIEASKARKLSENLHSEKIERFLIIAEKNIREACEQGLRTTSVRITTEIYPRDILVLLVGRLFSLGYRAYLPLSGFENDMFCTIEISW